MINTNIKKPIAVFDLEGTLFKRSNHFMREITTGYQVGIYSSIRTIYLKIKLVLIFTTYKIKLMDEVKMRAATIKTLAAFLKNTQVDYIARKAKTFAAKYLSHLRPELIPVIQQHKANGHTIILFTGMPQPYLDAIQQELGIDIALGTNLERDKGIFTGRLAHMPYQGIKRAEKLAEVIDELGGAADLSSSFAYGDSFIDRFYLDMVGNPVAVYPDKKLAEYASLYGWRVIPPGKKNELTISCFAKPPNQS